MNGTERVYNKCVNTSYNALRMVDKDGIPLRMPNTAVLSRLHSSYVLSPRGVPTKKTSTHHSYSGQLQQAKMKTLVRSLDTQSQDTSTYSSVYSHRNSYVNTTGLSSAGSSRHYMSTGGSQKKRSFGSGPSHSAKSMATKSVASRQSAMSRPLTSAPATDQLNDDLEKSNESPQGRRLEKEWSALSQCRALKRSSEIVSHRVDRMYFMMGNKLNLQSKYHVEDSEIQHLRDLQQARVSSRASRSGQSRRGDVYRLAQLDSVQLNGEGENGDITDGTIVICEGSKQFSRNNSTENVSKENKDPQVMVTQKVLTPKPNLSRKSPLSGWAGGDNIEKDSNSSNGINADAALHNTAEDQKVENDGSDVNEDEGKLSGQDDVNNGTLTANVEPEQHRDNEHVSNTTQGEAMPAVETPQPVDCESTRVNVDSEHIASDRATLDPDKVSLGVHREDVYSLFSDKDKTEVKSEDYLGINSEVTSVP